MDNHVNKKYPGKKSRSFGIFLLISGIVILTVSIGLPIMLNDSIKAAQWLVIGLIDFPIIGMFIWCWIATYYIIDHNRLIAKWGPFVWKVPIMDITIIRLNQKTMGGTWKLTLSWKCMEIKYKKYRSIFITPEKQNEFLNHLQSINDNIEIKQK